MPAATDSRPPFLQSPPSLSYVLANFISVRGKKKTNQKPEPQPSNTKIMRHITENGVLHRSPLKINAQPIEIRNDIRINLPPPIIIHRPIINHLRSVSLPRPHFIHRVPTRVAPPPSQPVFQINRSGVIPNKKKIITTSEALSGEKIRKCLDENLDIVYKDMNHRRHSINVQSKNNLSTEIYRPKLQQNLV